MIHPNMATMLGFITTDAAIERELLDEIVKECVKDTYNMISVDGDTSTNDMVSVLANGMAGNAEITAEGAEFDEFCKALPRYKRPKKIYFDVVPRNPTGKIEKPVLREKYCHGRLVEVQITG